MVVVIINYDTDIFKHTETIAAASLSEFPKLLQVNAGFFSFMRISQVLLNSLIGGRGNSEPNGMRLTGIVALMKCNNLPIFESFAIPQIERFR